MKKRVALGLSGGVDSAVAAALLIEQGYDVTGVFMECYNEPGCRTDGDHKDALAVALALHLPFKVLDFRKAYREKVLKYFVDEYRAGRTPNPDVVCNREIKFGMFYDWALRQGFDWVATGHYARIYCSQHPDLEVLDSQPWRRRSGCSPQSRGCCLLRGVDEKKDQSYFLFQLRVEQLARVLFPVGGMKKLAVRAEAKQRRLPVADKPDSQGICFVGEIPAKQFLQEMGLHLKEGEVVNLRGEIIGKHQGVWFYTIGQRHGFSIEVKTSRTPALYVIGKDTALNRLIVGTQHEAMRQDFEVREVHWIGEVPSTEYLVPKETQVRIRHLGELVGARCEWRGTSGRVTLKEPVFGIAPGQAAVFYEGEVCWGGGIIE